MKRLCGARGAGTVPSFLRKHGLPQRLADALCNELGLSMCRLAELQRAQRDQLLTALTQYPLVVEGHEGYAKVISAHDMSLLAMYHWTLCKFCMSA